MNITPMLLLVWTVFQVLTPTFAHYFHHLNHKNAPNAANVKVTIQQLGEAKTEKQERQWSSSPGRLHCPLSTSAVGHLLIATMARTWQLFTLL